MGSIRTNKNIEILVIIPARGGSKGIPRKNLRSLAGKPLIYYAIKNAFSITHGVIDVYVSSEDDEILSIASKFSAKTIKRDQLNAGDKVTLDPVIYDAYSKIRKIENKEYNLVITLQPTSPLLKPQSLNDAISKLLNENIDTLISGIYDTHLTWLKEDSKFFPNYKKRVNRQELPQLYKETGGFVISKANFIQQTTRFGKNIQIFPLGKSEAIDIDDFEDWNICDYYLKRKKILFVLCGNNEVGMGHVYNTLSIANEILNHRISFLVDSKSKLACDKILDSNYEVRIQQHNDIVEDIFELAPDIIINDRLDTTKEYMSALAGKIEKVINFEDLGEGSAIADLVINAMYPEGRVMANHYHGSKYFILRDEFLFEKEKKINKNIKNILLSFGGVDPNDYTRRILKIIYEYCQQENLNITVVTGMGYKNSKELLRDYPLANIKMDVKNMSDEIYNSDLIFTSAGRTTFEVASIGVPSIVLCQNKRETTHFFASEKNGFYNLGLGFEVRDEEILDAFYNAKKYKNRKLMNDRMIATDLKNGKRRVLNLIRKTIEHY